jgi:hypothetical protein
MLRPVGNPGQPIEVDLDEEELRFLRAALLDWGGPARPTDEIASALGFESAADISDGTWALWKRIQERPALSVEEWRRVLLAAEIVFASDVVGSGLDWATTSGIPDGESIAILRRLQRKLPRWRGSFQFRINESGNAEILDPNRPAG